MKICSIIFGVSLICALPASAAEMPSLFFTPAEIQTIEAPGTTAAPATADIHLGAVLYYGAGNWSVWLDGVRWTPSTRRADLEIIEVRPEQVRLQILSGRAPEPLPPVVLRPYQTYRAATGKIVEGM